MDIVNGSNNVALGLVLQGGLDMSNIPARRATLVEGGYGVKTYYDGAPYMMSANTAWLATNNTKPPLDDPAFRKALATSIDVETIVNVVYTGIVAATDSTGLRPRGSSTSTRPWWKSSASAMTPRAAKAMLDEAGYADADGDAFRDNKDGSPIALNIDRPQRLDRRTESIKVISESAKAVGINVGRLPGSTAPHGRYPAGHLRLRHRQRPAAQQHALDVPQPNLP